MPKVINTSIKEINGVRYSFEEFDNGSVIKRPYHRMEICEDTKVEPPINQEDIMAEILLSQAEILANQNAQDEVLAEMLLNSLEV